MSELTMLMERLENTHNNTILHPTNLSQNISIINQRAIPSIQPRVNPQINSNSRRVK